MKKQLLTIALLLATNTVLNASTTLPNGEFISGAVEREFPQGSRMSSYDPQTHKTVYFEYRGTKWTPVDAPKNSSIDAKGFFSIGGSPYAVTPTESRNFEIEGAQHEELVRNVQEILTIVRELRDRK
jgi:hypothetical protein